MWRDIAQKYRTQVEDAIRVAEKWQDNSNKWEQASKSFEGIATTNLNTIHRYERMVVVP